MCTGHHQQQAGWWVYTCTMVCMQSNCLSNNCLPKAAWMQQCTASAQHSLVPCEVAERHLEPDLTRHWSQSFIPLALTAFLCTSSHMHLYLGMHDICPIVHFAAAILQGQRPHRRSWHDILHIICTIESHLHASSCLTGLCNTFMQRQD